MRVPLSRLIPSAVVPDVLRTLLDAVEVTDFNLVTSDTAVDVAVTLASASGDPRIEIGGADGFAVVFRQVAALDLHLEGSLEIRLGLSEVTIELPSVLRPAQLVGGRWEPIAGQRQTLSLRSAHGSLGVRWHSADGFSLVWPEDPSGTVDVPPIELKETLIADTRIVVSARNVDVIPDPENLRIEILEATVVLPSDLPAAPDLKFSDVRIDRRGFTGTAEAAWNDVAFDATTRTFSGSVAGQLFGWHGGLDSVLLELNETLPIAADIRGKLLVPYFDEPVDVRVNLGAGGVYTVTLDAPTGDITLTREDLLELRLRSLSLGVDAASVATMRLSGGLTPLLMGSDGLEWPDFDVKDLTVDSTGKFTIAQAWVDLKDLATLDLWGFHFELRRIGLGYEEPRDRLWLDLSGGLRLIEAVPLGVDVEGFRLNWPRLLLDGVRPPLSLEQIQQTVAQIEVSFDGVYLFYGIPETVEFEGLIRFIKSAQSVAFAADIALRVPAAGFAAEAGLLIGMNLGQPPYPFLYVYFGVELPAGIPLGQSGLALKGALGLFGINVAPEKTAEQNWYYDWYKRGPIVGAHPTNKWRDERNAIALGIGVTITTVDGFVKGTRGLLIVVLPGPVLILEGRALLLEGLAPGEPPLRALAVFDGREKTIQLNIDAQAELIENTLEASGGVEAFFDLEDLSNWHLYLGQDSPRDRRVRANVLDLLRADSYLMLDSGGGGAFRARMGASAEFAPEIPDFGPVSAVASLDLDGDGLLTVGPEQLSGDVGLEASVKLSAFGFAMRLGARARVLLEGPRPFKVEAELEMEADLPDPLPDFEASFPFSWQAPTIEVPAIGSPVSSASLVSRFASSSVAVAIGGPPADHVELAEASPVVPLDADALIEFRPEVNQRAGAPFLRHPGGNKTFDAGLMRFTPSVERIELFEHRKDRPWLRTEQDWTLVASTLGSGSTEWSGVWLADADPRGDTTPPARRLLLGSGNPLMHTAAMPPRGKPFLMRDAAGAPTPAEAVLEDYPTLMTCTGRDERPVCVGFAGLDPKGIPAGRELRVDGIQLTSSRVMKPVQTAAGSACLSVDGYLDLRFPQPVVKVVIRLCTPSTIRTTDLAGRSQARRRSSSQLELTAARDAARKQGEPFEPRACRLSVPLTVNASPNEWVFDASLGFTCLSLFRLGAFSIAEICTVTADEHERAQQTAKQCAANERKFPDTQVLRTGRYYRLRVHTSVAGALRLDSLPFPQNHPLAGIASALYEDALAELGLFDAVKTFEQLAFFQTDTPPVRLEPYIHATHPAPQAERVFREDDLAIRFRRDYVQAMFASEPFPLELVIRAPDGRLVSAPEYDTRWTAAQSATRFPEEETWDAHRQQHAMPAAAVAPDRVLSLRRRAGAPALLPTARYELLATGGAGGAALEPSWDAASDWSLNDDVWMRGGSAKELLIGGRAEWGDIDCTLDCVSGPQGVMGLLLRVQEAESSAAVPFATSAIRVLWPTSAAPSLSVDRVRRAAPADAWQVQPLFSRIVAMPAQPMRVRAQLLERRLRIWVFENRLAEVTLPDHPVTGRVALTTTSAAAEFRRVRVRDSVLHRVRFVTSRFNRFPDLVNTYTNPGPGAAFEVPAAGPAAQPDPVLLAQRRSARAQWDWNRAEVDYRDALLHGGRAALEAARIALRSARAAHQQAFQTWSSALATLMLEPQTPYLDVHLIRAAAGIVAVWLRSPESLDLQHAVLQNVSSSSSSVIGRIGRTVLGITRANAPQGFRLLAGPGSQHVILVQEASAVWAPGKYDLTLTYQRDLSDETGPGAHRFDRSVEAREGQRTPEVATIIWRIN